MSSDGVEAKDPGGRPKEGIKFGQHKNAFGWDPVGNKQFAQDFDVQNQKTAFQADPRAERKVKAFSTEHNDILKHLKIKSKSAGIITESLKTQDNDSDTGTMLDENNIL
jgi:hypothetical protein